MTVEAYGRVLATELGKPVWISNLLKEDLIFVEPHGSPPKAVLSAVASALNATIRQEEKGFFVERTKADRDRTHSKILEQRTEWLNRRLKLDADFRADALAGRSDPSQIFAQIGVGLEKLADKQAGKTESAGPFTGGELLPASAMLEALLPRIGVPQLAALPSGEVAVYEDDPVAGEHPLPPHEDLSASYEKAVESLRTQQIPANLQQLISTDGMSVTFGDLASNRPAHRFRLTEISSPGGIQFLLEGFDSSGNRIVLNGCFAGAVDEVLDSTSLIRTASKDPNTRKALLSDPASLAIQRTKEWQLGPMPEWLRHPDKTEPLNVFVGEALSNIANEDPDKPVVFFAPDSLWSEVAQSTRGAELNLDVLESMMKSDYGYRRVDVAGSSIGWRPLDEESLEARRADRKELAKFPENVAEDGSIDINSVARLFSDASPEISPLDSAWLVNIESRLGGPLVRCEPSDELYRIIGAISEDDFRTLSSGRSLTCGQLGIADLVSRFIRDDLSLKTEGTNLSDLSKHPSEVFTDANISECSVRLDSAQVVMAGFMDVSDRHEHWSPISDFERNFGSKIGFKVSTNGDSPKVETSRDDFEAGNAHSHYRFCVRQELTIRITNPRGLSVSGQILGGVKLNDNYLTYAELPKQMRDDIWNSLCERMIQFTKQWQEWANSPWPPNSLAPKPKPVP